MSKNAEERARCIFILTGRQSLSREQLHMHGGPWLAGYSSGREKEEGRPRHSATGGPYSPAEWPIAS